MSKTLRILLVAGASAFGFAFAASSMAASVTLSDPMCDSFALTQDASGKQTLTCVVSSVPNCTITAGGSAADGASATIGTSLTLNASCTGSPTSYSWSRAGSPNGSCTASTCAVSESTAGPVTYAVSATNGIGPGSASATVTWSNVTMPTCTLTATPASVVASGGTVMLRTTCSSGATPTDYVWNGPGISPDTIQAAGTYSLTVVPPATFTVAPRVNGAAGTSKSASVTTLVPAPDRISCTVPFAGGSAFTATKVIDAAFPEVGGGGHYYFTDNASYFSGTLGTTTQVGYYRPEALVLRFKPPVNESGLQMLMQYTASSTGAQTKRTLTVSTSPCDFSLSSPNAIYASDRMQAYNLRFRTDGVVSSDSFNLDPNVPYYYINVMNWSAGTQTCSAGRCDAYFVLDNR